MHAVQSERMMQVNSALMIHGAGGGGWEWDVWRRVFVAAGWRVSAPDLQPSAAGLGETTLDDYQAQVHVWLETRRPRVVVGASLGGLLALRCHPAARGATLVLVNPMPPANFAGVVPLGGRYPDLVLWRRSASLASTARSLPDADPTTWQIAWRRWRDESGAVMNAASSGVPVEHPRAPILMVISDGDADVPAATSRALASALGADVLACADASHVGPLLGRHASDIAERVLAWLRLRS